MLSRITKEEHEFSFKRLASTRLGSCEFKKSMNNTEVLILKKKSLMGIAEDPEMMDEWPKVILFLSMKRA